MENDDFGFDGGQEVRDYEKISYGKYAYKRVQRLRKKGARRGFKVPYLGFELTKPEKPRIAFWIVAGISALLFVGALVGIGLLYNELVRVFSDMSGLGSFLKNMFDPDVLKGSLGMSALPGILFALIYVLIAILFILPIVAAVYFYRFVRDAFFMARCSKEEFAKGGIVSSRIFWLIVLLVVGTIIFIVLLAFLESAKAKGYAGLIFGCLAAALVGLLALTLYEKSKCGKWFKTIDEWKQENYKEHEKALRRISSHLRMERRMWDNI